MDPVELIRLNTEIENEITPAGDLVPLPGKEGVLLSVSHHRDGLVAYFRRDVPSGLRERMRAAGLQSAFEEPESIQRILDSHAPRVQVQAGVGAYFARIPAPDEYPDATLREGRFVVLVEGKPVSWAWTQDGSAGAAELAVEALPEHRRRGFGRQVVSAWAAHVMGTGQVAFYSYLIGNSASAALARSLGVVQYAEWVTFHSVEH